MLKVTVSSRYKKDSKKSKKQGKDSDKLKNLLSLLVEQKPLPIKNEDHQLSGDYNGCRECHIEPDWLLIYRIDKNKNCLVLERLGSHSELFN